MNIIPQIQYFSGENTDEFLAFSLAYIGESLLKHAEKNVFRPQKISAVHYNILCTLSVQSPRPASDISKFVLGSAANFSAILGRMDKDGLIEREVSEKDRREIFVFITPKGQKIFSETRKNFQKNFQKFFQKFSKEEKKQISESIAICSKF